MTKPTQSPYLFRGLPLGHHFGVEYEAQETIPIDGSNPNGRLYSPFIVRVLPPTILGNNGADTLLTGLNPQRGPGTGGTIRESNRESTAYATTISSVAIAPEAQSSYKSLLHNGNAIPGLSETSVTTLSSRYNSATFTQLFGPAVQSAVRGTTNGQETVVVPAMANDLTALSILLQVKRLMAVPPLIMLINPESMSIQNTKIAQFQERTRNGYIYQAWGEELLKLSFTFRIGAYTVGNPSQNPNLPSGVQRASRRDSAAFQQLTTMLTIFQSAGYIQDTVQKSKANLMVGNIAIEYDQKSYVGHFDTFSFSEDETQQHGGLQFELEFTAIKVFDHAEAATVVSPLSGPSNPGSGGFRGSLSRTGNTASAQFFTAPTIGIEGSNVPAQPWAGASVTDEGITTPETIRTRRR